MSRRQRCAACRAEVQDGSRFCPGCGSALERAEGLATETSASDVPSSLPPPSDSSTGGRFIPGTVLADRYRIVGLLGRGGMGEVYRADDLKLGQAVALKWLPPDVERDASRLERFLGEVRHSLKVTHPNVCRVFDVGEVPSAGSGQHYLSMEYVDGEDLASLLRRIGRLPEDKAVQVARQLCAGLAAAHDEGVLHRDLKPGNVMIDGRGRAKITDFGLAGATRGIEGAEARAGTPAYMAPEQLAGGKLTERTDIYALGLVLYELFTGKRAYEAQNARDLARLQQDTTPSSLSSHVQNIDPLVESIIMRCLAADPDQRPESVSAVAAALPGGDPLAAAIAAGETPSPDMVAAAGGRGGLSARAAWSLLIAALLMMTLAVVARAPASLLDRTAPEKPPAVLIDHTRELLRELELYDPEARDAWGFNPDLGSLEWIRDRTTRADWYGEISGNLPWLRFWYRQRDGELSSPAGYGYTTRRDPPLISPGELLVELDLEGRLLSLDVVPDPEGLPEVGNLSEEELHNEPQGESNVQAFVDWTFLFDAAGIDASEMRPVAPRTIPPVFADQRFGWEGRRENDPDVPLRVEAASLGGIPVMFRVENPWEFTTIPQGIPTAFAILIVFIFIGGGILARRNLRAGSGDVRGANWLVAIYIVLHTVSILPVLELSIRPGVLVGQVAQMLSSAAFQGALLWICYIGLEPIVRKRWPAALVSWSRLLQGGILDPRVGRDVLIGCVAGSSFAALATTDWWFSHWTAQQSPLIGTATPWFGNSLAPFLVLLHLPLHLMQLSMILLLEFVLLSMLLRKTALAVAVFALLGGIGPALGSPYPWIAVPAAVLMALMWVVLILRVGFLAGAVANSIMFLMGLAGVSIAFGEWYARESLIWLISYALLAGFGFWVALAGRPMFGSGPAES